MIGTVGVVGLHLAKPHPAMRAYCAQMPDGIGLFLGSQVTVLGLPLGRVTRIEPRADGVRVDFELPADRRLASNVGATTVSDTLVADRKLAVLGTAQPGSPSWDPAQCITRTLTPKSLTQTLTALARLADQLNGADNPDQANLLSQGLAAVDRSTAGHGAQVNEIVHQLGSALSGPDAAIGHLGGLVDALADLAHSAANGWVDVKDMITRMTDAMQGVKELIVPPVADVLDNLRDLLPAVNDIVVEFGTPLLRNLDGAADRLPMLTAGIASLSGLLTMVPALSRAFTDAVEPASGRAVLTYTPPAVAIPQEAAAQICAAINALPGDRCGSAADGFVGVPLVPLVLGSAGAR